MSLTALPVAFLALEAPVWMLYASMAVIGVEWGLYDPFWLTCMQREVAPDMISRVSAYDYLGVLAFYPAGLALAGPLADAFGRSTVLWASAAVAIAGQRLPAGVARRARAARDGAGGPEATCRLRRPVCSRSARPGPASERLAGRLPLGVEAGVAAAGRHELVVRAALDDAAVVDHEDLVGVAHRAQAVGDDHARCGR